MTLKELQQKKKKKTLSKKFCANCFQCRHKAKKNKDTAGERKEHEEFQRTSTKQQLRNSILLLHEVFGVVEVALVQNHLSQLFKLLARLHVINEVHQKLDAFFFFHKLAVLFWINLKVERNVEIH